MRPRDCGCLELQRYPEEFHVRRRVVTKRPHESVPPARKHLLWLIYDFVRETSIQLHLIGRVWFLASCGVFGSQRQIHLGPELPATPPLLITPLGRVGLLKCFDRQAHTTVFLAILSIDLFHEHGFPLTCMLFQIFIDVDTER